MGRLLFLTSFGAALNYLSTNTPALSLAAFNAFASILFLRLCACHFRRSVLISNVILPVLRLFLFGRVTGYILNYTVTSQQSQSESNTWRHYQRRSIKRQQNNNKCIIILSRIESRPSPSICMGARELPYFYFLNYSVFYGLPEMKYPPIILLI